MLRVPGCGRCGRCGRADVPRRPTFAFIWTSQCGRVPLYALFILASKLQINMLTYTYIRTRVCNIPNYRWLCKGPRFIVNSNDCRVTEDLVTIKYSRGILASSNFPEKGAQFFFSGKKFCGMRRHTGFGGSLEIDHMTIIDP